MICGIDEVGRGCLAGDVYACAVAFHSDAPEGVRDSKKLTAKNREDLDILIRNIAHVSIGIATVAEIDKINILQATMLAMSRAFHGLPKDIGISQILVDGNRVPSFGVTIPAKAIIKGDDSVPEIAASSIVAKVARDKAICELHEEFPAYDWISNKGYGSKKHLAALLKNGPTIHHRMTFAPMKNG